MEGQVQLSKGIGAFLFRGDLRSQEVRQGKVERIAMPEDLLQPPQAEGHQTPGQPHALQRDEISAQAPTARSLRRGQLMLSVHETPSSHEVPDFEGDRSKFMATLGDLAEAG